MSQLTRTGQISEMATGWTTAAVTYMAIAGQQ